MASSQPLLGTDEEPTMKSRAKQGCKYCCEGLGCVLLVIFILVWAVQAAMFLWATTLSGCSSSQLEGYHYPGADSSDAGDAAFNVLPQISLLAEREPLWYGAAFDVLPSNEASTVASAPVGAWWRTWGPIFWTYTYEDVANSKTTLYMRRNLLRLGQSHRIGRCDGKGPRVTFSEGSNFFKNRIRKWMGMNQGLSFKIYLDNEQVGVAEETDRGFQSLTFRKENGDSDGSSILKERHFHGNYDLWLVKNHKDVNMPYYVSSAATLLFAFHTVNEDKRLVESQRANDHGKGSKPPSSEPVFLEAAVASSTEKEQTVDAEHMRKEALSKARHAAKASIEGAKAAAAKATAKAEHVAADSLSKAEKDLRTAAEEAQKQEREHENAADQAAGKFYREDAMSVVKKAEAEGASTASNEEKTGKDWTEAGRREQHV